MNPRAQAEVALRQCLGASATFREGQWEAIEAIAVRRERALVVQRTGWGKSLVYFIATHLMRDQERMAQRLGIRAASLNSANAAEWSEIESALRRDDIDVLLISPERLANDRFRREALSAMRTGLLVVDEAHCVAPWARRRRHPGLLH